MSERDGDPTGALAPQSPPLIKAQTKLTILFVLMAISGGILAQLSYQQFLPEKTCDDPTTTMERIGISLFVISTFFVGFNFIVFVLRLVFDRRHAFSAFLALLIHVAAVFLTLVVFAEAFLYDAGCGVGLT
ncbi:MAG: hypothetical protein VX052_05510 [Candidatus Thermoplasmatota archaeon]|nr:hypothetical protein [Candidatus Thermoplasmatota archaeon]